MISDLILTIQETAPALIRDIQSIETAIREIADRLFAPLATGEEPSIDEVRARLEERQDAITRS